MSTLREVFSSLSFREILSKSLYRKNPSVFLRMLYSFSRKVLEK